MKKYLVFIAIVFLKSGVLCAQDMIVTKSGTVISAYNLSIAETAVFYTTVDDPNGNISRLSKNDILIIQMKDGTKIDVEAGVQAANETTPIENASIGAVTPLNAERIAASAKNTPAYSQPNGKKKTKEVIVEYRYSDDSVIETNELSISFEATRLFYGVNYNGSGSRAILNDGLFPLLYIGEFRQWNGTDKGCPSAQKIIFRGYSCYT